MDFRILGFWVLGFGVFWCGLEEIVFIWRGLFIGFGVGVTEFALCVLADNL